MNTSPEINYYIQNQTQWCHLPPNIKSKLGNDYIEYNKSVLNFSLQNQLRFRDNLISKVFKNEKRYYEKLIFFSKENLFLYPYHLQDKIVSGLRITAFQYYIDLLCNVMNQERSYDFIPNFTAADCLRLLGIGRNQFIDLMNTLRGNNSTNNSSHLSSPGSDKIGVERNNSRMGMMTAGKRLLGLSSGRKVDNVDKIRALLPKVPLNCISIEPWWLVNIGIVLEPDMDKCDESMKQLIDMIIDNGPIYAGSVDRDQLIWLYQQGMVYFDVPVESDCVISVPTLDKFVMNRTTGDYFEVLLYKIFVAIDENSTVDSLANILQIPLPLVQQAVSVFCRLQFAQKKLNHTNYSKYLIHKTWLLSATDNNENSINQSPISPVSANRNTSNELETFLLEDGLDNDEICIDINCVKPSHSMFISPSISEDNFVNNNDSASANTPYNSIGSTSGGGVTRKIGFIFDSSLTAFLMMGNLSVGLKNHAVTMFEVGKLSEEGLDSFLNELDSISDVGEGEAQRYYEHAVNLRHTIRKLRQIGGGGVDLLRCGSLLSLDSASRCRMLVRNYRCLISMAPINYNFIGEAITPSIAPIINMQPNYSHQMSSSYLNSICSDLQLPHFGPQTPEMTSLWFRLFLYSYTKSGPTTMLLVGGTRLRRLPKQLLVFNKLLITPWQQQESVVASLSCALITINDALSHGPLLVQGLQLHSSAASSSCPSTPTEVSSEKQIAFPLDGLVELPNDLTNIIHKLNELLNLSNRCGYITYLQYSDNTCHLLNLHFGIPLFDDKLNQRILDRLSNVELFQSQIPEESTTGSSTSDSNINKTFIDNYQSNTEKTIREFNEFIERYLISSNNMILLPKESLIFDKGCLTQFLL